MRHADVKEQGLIERYLLDQLTPEEAADFERHYLACPRCLEQLELAETLQEGLRHAAVEDASRLRAASSLGIVAWLARLGRPGQLAALALVGLAILGPFALLPRLNGPAPQGNTPVFFLGPERAEATVQQIRPGSELSGAVLALELDPSAPRGPFRADLTPLAEPGTVLWQGESLRLDHNGTLTLSLPADFLTPGEYQLQVFTRPTDSEPLARFPFRILPPAR